MAFLFVPWGLALGLAWAGHRRAALLTGLVALALSVAMFRYHTNESIDLSL